MLKSIFISLLLSSPAYAQIALYTGTFDPPHLAHREVIENAIKTVNLEAIYVNPGATPHKPNAQPLDFRVILTEMAFFDLPEASFPPKAVQELIWDGRYVDAKNLIIAQNPGKVIYQVMGSDRIVTISEEEMKNTRLKFLVSVRDQNFELPENLKPFVDKKIFLLPPPKLRTSSTDIRAELKKGIRPELLRDTVYKAIKKDGGYKVSRCIAIFQ